MRRPGSRFFLAAALTACAFAPAIDGVSAKEPIHVSVDRAKIMRIARPATTIILGNPSIADASVQNEQTLVITGKSFGSTNLIVLDADGQPIADEVLMVRAAEESSVIVYRGAKRQTLTCAPICQPAISVGDDQELFDQTEKQVKSRNGIARTEAGGGGE